MCVCEFTLCFVFVVVFYRVEDPLPFGRIRFVVLVMRKGGESS